MICQQRNRMFCKSLLFIVLALAPVLELSKWCKYPLLEWRLFTQPSYLVRINSNFDVILFVIEFEFIGKGIVRLLMNWQLMDIMWPFYRQMKKQNRRKMYTILILESCITRRTTRRRIAFFTTLFLIMIS